MNCYNCYSRRFIAVYKQYQPQFVSDTLVFKLSVLALRSSDKVDQTKLPVLVSCCIRVPYSGKLSWISRFCGYSWKFSSWNLEAWHSFVRQKWARNENRTFHQFSLGSFPLHSILHIDMGWNSRTLIHNVLNRVKVIYYQLEFGK